MNKLGIVLVLLLSFLRLGPRVWAGRVEFLDSSFKTLEGRVLYSQGEDEPEGFCAGMCFMWFKSFLQSEEENRCWNGFNATERRLAPDVTAEIKILQAPFNDKNSDTVFRFQSEIEKYLPAGAGFHFNENLNHQAQEDAFRYGQKSVLLHFLNDGYSALILIKRTGGGIHAIAVGYKKQEGAHKYVFIDPNFGEYRFSSFQKEEAFQDIKQFLNQYFNFYQTQFDSSLRHYFLIEGPDSSLTPMKESERETAAKNVFSSDDF